MRFHKKVSVSISQKWENDFKISLNYLNDFTEFTHISLTFHSYFKLISMILDENEIKKSDEI